MKTVVPLGQEQFPEKSKETLQVPDYEITFEAGSKTNTSCILVEVKLVDGDKQTYELQKYKYEVLKEYSSQKNEPLLFGIFWIKQGVWTINSIESFSEKVVHTRYRMKMHAWMIYQQYLVIIHICFENSVIENRFFQKKM
ncbi:hypothetical protein KK420_10790 [Clostridioides difficile]|nr:hypothetical protein [Clostridioides difficile]